MKCLERKHKCGHPFHLAFHYSIYHEDKISKCKCGDETLIGNCIMELAWGTKGGAPSTMKTVFVYEEYKKNKKNKLSVFLD